MNDALIRQVGSGTQATRRRLIPQLKPGRHCESEILSLLISISIAKTGC